MRAENQYEYLDAPDKRSDQEALQNSRISHDDGILFRAMPDCRKKTVR